MYILSNNNKLIYILIEVLVIIYHNFINFQAKLLLLSALRQKITFVKLMNF